jgi:hypothetical protein
MYPLCCPQLLCIHGNSCLLGSTIGNWQWLKQTGSDHHCERHTSICVFCWPKRVGIQFGLYPFVLEWGSSSEVDILCWLLLGVMTIFSSVALLLNSSQISFVLWQFWTIICMVFRTILILHSLTQCCIVSCFSLVFSKQFSNTITNSTVVLDVSRDTTCDQL